MFLFTPYYELNDDTFKVFFTQGVGTELVPSDFIGYSSPLWGLLLKTLFTFFPRVPWYGIGLLTVQFLSLGALLYALALGPRPAFRVLSWWVVYFVFLYTFFVELQFTVTSILAAQCAFLLMLGLWQKSGRSPNRWAWTLAGFLLVVASLIRLDGLFIAAFCSLPLFLYAWWVADPSSRRVLGARKLYFLVPALVIAGGAVYNHLWYEVTPGWAQFNRFDHERLELQDYRIDPYNAQTKPFFDAAGWSENDYHMFKDWYFMDKDLYDADRMRRLAQCFPRWGSGGKPQSYHSPAELVGDFWPQTVFLYFLTYLLLVSLRSFRFLLLQMGWVMAVLTAMIYFLRAPDRVVLPLITFPLVIAVYFSDLQSLTGRNQGGSLRRILTTLGVVFLVLFSILGLRSYTKYHLFNQQAQKGEKALKACVAELNPQENQLYVVWGSAFPYEAFNALDNFELFRKFHIFQLAVYQRSPNAQKMLDRFGIKNLLKDLVDNPKVSLICTPEEGAYYHQYMLEKYRINTYPVKTYECPFFRVFRISSKPPARSKAAASAVH